MEQVCLPVFIIPELYYFYNGKCYKTILGQTWKSQRKHTFFTSVILPISIGVVSGDVILTDMKILLRTKATAKKSASAINVITLDKSVALPTTGAIKVEYAVGKDAGNKVPSLITTLTLDDAGQKVDAAAFDYDSDDKVVLATDVGTFKNKPLWINII